MRKSCEAFIAERQKSEAVSSPRRCVFHVKHPVPEVKGVSRETQPVPSARYMMNQEILLPYTKLSEDHIKDILDIHPTQQSAQGMRRDPQLLGSEFLSDFDDLNAAPQRSGSFLQQFSLPRSAN
jgi:hypothetical protein